MNLERTFFKVMSILCIIMGILCIIKGENPHAVMLFAISMLLDKD